jgi:steroid delta-isomerase-like uncharacterized protein
VTLDDAKTILSKGIEFWNAHDRERFLALYDEDVVFFEQPTGQELHGREEFGKGFYDVQTDAYPDNEIKDALVFAEGDLVCFHGRFTGTHTGTFRGPVELPATGKTVDSPFAFIAEFRNGKVKSARIFYDRLTNLEQEGIVNLEQLAAQLPVA